MIQPKKESKHPQLPFVLLYTVTCPLLHVFLNRIFTGALAWVAKIWIWGLPKPLFIPLGILGYILREAAAFGIYLLLFYRFIRTAIPRYYNEDSFWKSATFLLLPGELLRFTLSLPGLGIGGVYAFPASLLFEWVWLPITGRMEPVRQLGEFVWHDCLGYFLCYYAYFAVYTIILLFLYRRAWYISAMMVEDGVDL